MARTRFTTNLLAGVVLAACFSACSETAPEPAETTPEATAPVVAPARKPIDPDKRLQGAVLVLFDTLRADHVSSYGYERPTSPALDALAARGVRFDQAISSAPWTMPAVSGLLAGDYPERAFQGRLKKSLVKRLSADGVRTGAVTEGGYVSKAFGMDLGFDKFHEETGPVQIVRKGESGKLNTSGIEKTFELAREWLTEHQDERFFLLVHTYEPHTPYTRLDFTEGLDAGQVGEVFATDGIVPRLNAGETVLTASETEYVTAMYDSGVLAADRHLAELLAHMDELGLSDSTLVVVAGDHGEELGSHYPSRTGGHGHALLDSMLRVPLVVHDPTRDFELDVVPTQVRLIDVVPTIADLLEVAPDRRIEGHSLVPLMQGTDDTPRMALAAQTRVGTKRLAVRHRGYKYISTVGPEREGKTMLRNPPERQLYALATDPGERRNVVDEFPEIAQAFETVLQRQHLALSAPTMTESEEDLDPEVLERLKSLGYVE